MNTQVGKRNSGFGPFSILGLSLVLFFFAFLAVMPKSGLQVRTRPTPQTPKKIAIVNDDIDRLDTIGEYIESFMVGYIPVPFIDCPSLIAAMDGGQRFQAYAVDLNMPGVNGLECTSMIIHRHPEAVVIGNSMIDDWQKEEVELLFKNRGAKGFNQGTSRGLIDLLRSLGL